MANTISDHLLVWKRKENEKHSKRKKRVKRREEENDEVKENKRIGNTNR